MTTAASPIEPGSRILSDSTIDHAFADLEAKLSLYTDTLAQAQSALRRKAVQAVSPASAVEVEHATSSPTAGPAAQSPGDAEASTSGFDAPEGPSFASPVVAEPPTAGRPSRWRSRRVVAGAVGAPGGALDGAEQSGHSEQADILDSFEDSPLVQARQALDAETATAPAAGSEPPAAWDPVEVDATASPSASAPEWDFQNESAPLIPDTWDEPVATASEVDGAAAQKPRTLFADEDESDAANVEEASWSLSDEAGQGTPGKPAGTPTVWASESSESGNVAAAAPEVDLAEVQRKREQAEAEEREISALDEGVARRVRMLRRYNPEAPLEELIAKVRDAAGKDETRSSTGRSSWWRRK